MHGYLVPRIFLELILKLTSYMYRYYYDHHDHYDHYDHNHYRYYYSHYDNYYSQPYVPKGDAGTITLTLTERGSMHPVFFW